VTLAMFTSGGLLEAQRSVIGVYFIGGDTTMASGLSVRLCHAFLVLFFND